MKRKDKWKFKKWKKSENLKYKKQILHKNKNKTKNKKKKKKHNTSLFLNKKKKKEMEQLKQTAPPKTPIKTLYVFFFCLMKHTRVHSTHFFLINEKMREQNTRKKKQQKNPKNKHYTSFFLLNKKYLPRKKSTHLFYEQKKLNIKTKWNKKRFLFLNKKKKITKNITHRLRLKKSPTSTKKALWSFF